MYYFVKLLYNALTFIVIFLSVKSNISNGYYERPIKISTILGIIFYKFTLTVPYNYFDIH